MPAPKFLAGLPKPLLFGLYGALGGFVGALFVAEPLYSVLDDDLHRGPIARADLVRHLLITVAVWSAGLTALICAALTVGQHTYLKGTAPDAARVALGVGGGVFAGAFGGCLAQLFYFAAPLDNFAANALVRIVAWAILGGLAGTGLSFLVPNMKWAHGLAGGAVGGAVGCIGFLALSMTFGEALGRVAGGTALGFCMGLALTVAELSFRRAWLEVRYGERETVTVTLGPEPVEVGGDARACTVWARGAAPVAVRFFVRDGQVICDDRESGTETEVGDGYEMDVGRVTVTVRTASGEPAVVVRRKRPKAQPTAREAPEDEAPLPVAEIVPPPVPVKPAIKPPPDPSMCPGCGRKCPGAPGGRYCMVCDRTY